MGAQLSVRDPFFLQRGPLMHAEAVLFVRNHKPQLMISDIPADQRMGSEHRVAGALGQLLQDLLPFLCPGAPCQQPAMQAQGLQRLNGAPVMLRREDFRRRHHGGLESGTV